MRHSEELDKLFAALNKAQASLGMATKDAKNPFFKSSYADYKSVRKAVHDPLKDNGLTLNTVFDIVGERSVAICVLGHASGQWMSGQLPMAPVKNEPQAIGSCITYYRRYLESAMMGLATGDDDGEAAHGRSRQALPPKAKPSRDLSF